MLEVREGSERCELGMLSLHTANLEACEKEKGLGHNAC